MAPSTPTPNGRSNLRDEFISWNTVKHILLILGFAIPVITALWAWTSAAQTQAVEVATTLGQHIEQNDNQHDRYDNVLDKTSKAIESNSHAIARVTECLENHLDYTKQTEAKLDRLMTEQRNMIQSTRDTVTTMQVEQRVLRDEIKRLAEEVKKNGSH
jgi:Skp family chaperone for outer membrane proteins